VSGYCTTTDMTLVCNADEITAYADDSGTGSAGSGILQGSIDWASYALKGILIDRYPTIADPSVYVAGTYRGLELRTADLAVAKDRSRQGGPVVAEDHPSLVWALRVRLGLDDLA